MKQIGHSKFRKEGPAKVRGIAKYVDDLSFPNMIYGATVRSTTPRGRLQGITFDPNFDWADFSKVTAKDIPGENVIALIQDDQPALADKAINHPEEAVALLAHPNKNALRLAMSHVTLNVQPLPHVLTLEESCQGSPIIWGNDNIFKSIEVLKGDVDPVWARADHIVEGTYFTGAQEHLYIEPNGMIALANPKDGVTVWGSMQCPYYIHKALCRLFKLPESKIRVVQTETGGGFGGKEEYPSMLAAHAALLAWKSGRPVKMIYDRAEDMAATTKRHPSRTKHKTAVSKDGTLLAMDIEFVIDGGAYMTLSPVVLSRGTIHAAGPYFCPNIRIRSRAVATNTPPHGAFRGFGAPQSIFALERHLDVIAHTIGISPEAIRRKNFIKTGQTTATNQVIREPVHMDALLDEALKKSQYSKKLSQFRKSNAKSPIKKGIGIATFMHGAGFTGSGEKYLASVVGIEASPEGLVTVLAGSTEIGQGTNTIFSQIAAETLGIDYDRVSVAQPDTARVPDSGPTVASRTSMIVGKLVESAAIGLKQTLIQSGFLKTKYTETQFKKACRDCIKKLGRLQSFSQYKVPPSIHWDDQTYQGDAYGAFGWAAYVAEVSVNPLTYAVTVDDFVAVQEVGRVIHPVLAAGQIEGGVAQGIGYALTEDVIWKNGRMANTQMSNYIMLTSADTPPIRVFFHEQPTVHGPAGAKGIGELPMDGPAPAILNAVFEATGTDAKSIPLTPERMFELWSANS